MIENDNIKELFSKSLENHTSTVRPEVWNGLQAKMAAAGVSSVAATKGLSVLTKWIIGSAAVTGTAVITTIAVMNTGKEETARPQPAQTEQLSQQTAAAAPQDVEQTAVTGQDAEQTNDASVNDIEVITGGLPGTYGDVQEAMPFKPFVDRGRSGSIGDAGAPATNHTGNPSANPASSEPGKVVEIPVEKEPETPAVSAAGNPEFKAPVVHMPNVFTPNGDGSNDEYFIEFENVPTATITFMDQNNKTVYSTTNKSFRWDGTVEGDPVQNGPYACIVVYQDMSGKTHKKITLIDIRR